MLVAVSPHLDDVVLGCAGLVAAHAGALVVTVTAGRPGPHLLTEWDRLCGFAQGDDVIGARQKEDSAALSRLGARPEWLDFLDRQYADGHSPDPRDIAGALQPLAREAELVATPLGLLHPDHVAVAAACLEVMRSLPSARWIVYEDVIYRATAGVTEDALVGLRNHGVAVREVEFPEAVQKRSAIAAYPSQVRGLGALLDDAYRPERYWSVTLA